MHHPQPCDSPAGRQLPFPFQFAKALGQGSATPSAISLQALGWMPFLALEFSAAWEHCDFLIAGSIIDQ